MSADSQRQPPFRLPLPATLAALVALAVLWHVTGGSVALTVLAVALIAPYLTAARVGGGWWVPWALRIVSFAMVAVAVSSTPVSSYDGLLDPRASSLFAHLCAAELAVQVWRREPAMGPRGAGAVLLIGLILAAAGNTFDHIGMAIGAPVFVVLLALSLPAFYPGRAPRPPLYRTAGPMLLMLLPAMAIGGALHYNLRVHRQDLTEWSNRLLKPLGGAAMSGFGAAPMLTESYDMQLSPVRVLRISGLEDVAYLRGASFDYYSGGRWGPSLADELFNEVAPALLEPRAPGLRAEVSRLRSDYNLLFAPLHAAGVEPAPDSSLAWAPEQGFALKANRRDLNPYTYSFTLSKKETFQGPLCFPLTEPQRMRLLTLPEGLKDELGPLAQEIGAGAKTPQAKIEAVQQFILSNNNYSLRVRRGEGDPIVAFLKEKRAAHCQYFASSAALLLRLLGVPARYASGYLAHERDGGDRVIVRQRDAHAWTEAYVDGQGWVTVDTTPGSGRPDQLWGDIPIWLSFWETVQDRLLEFRDWMSDRSNFDARTLLWVVPGIAGLFFAAHVLRRHRRPVFVSGYSSPGREWQELSQRFSALLERQGAPCPPGVPWSEHLRRFSSQRSVVSSAVVSTKGAEEDIAFSTKVSAALMSDALEFADEYNRVRFGHPDDQAALRDLQLRLDRIAPRR